ncbi:MAG: M23 family metallopeptidase [Bacteroidetes bacterium]|nr:M23 family metallopeptidase [Bacteroidota bacterium]
MANFKFSDLKKSSVYITPNFPVIETKRYKFKIQTVISLIVLYSLFVSVLVITILALTPAKQFIFVFENEKLIEQAEHIKMLEERLVFLSNELNHLASKNKKLQYAMMLATGDSIDTTSAIYDSLKHETRQNLPYGGNILHVFTMFWEKFFSDDSSQMKIYFIKPLSGFITREFEPENGHMGIDFSVKTGTPVVASAGGIIIFAGTTVDYGNSVIIEHNNGYITKYLHCSSLLKKEREVVEQGEILALSGNTGIKTTGPHLHFEIWKNGKPIEPKKILINLNSEEK